MRVRKRNRVSGTVTGTRFTASNNSTVSKTSTVYSEIDDIVGNPKGQNMLISRQRKVTTFSTINVTTGKGQTLRRWSNYPSDGSTNIPAHGPTFPGENNVPVSSHINRVLAGSGPLNPKVNLPLSLFELREVPRMLKHAGDLLHKLWTKPHALSAPSEIASATLAFQFGWAPIIDDISKLLNFQETVDKRRKFLEKLDAGGKVRTRVGLGDDSSETEVDIPISSVTGTVVRAKRKQITRHTAWGVTYWQKRSNTTIFSAAMSVSQREHIAFKSAFGLNRGHIPIAVWKALPWTWLIDWFANVSDVLQSSYNTMYFIPSNMCVMNKYETRHTEIPYGSNNDRVSPFVGEIVSRYRAVVPSPTIQSPLRIPIMDPFKASVLGSLAVLRIRRAAK